MVYVSNTLQFLQRSYSIYPWMAADINTDVDMNGDLDIGSFKKGLGLLSG